ncbi:EamA family transporter [Porticoccaceae bacterium]|nr:EamA family transporter [Porticoccaceae bacterium]MDC0010888.1 EamA family transporter [Porticoccaceae bacterium]MDC1453401.1 EamA family transporter [Porticoccaceae bacterium]
MNALNSGLYLATILIWGSTWLAITYQLGEVDPLVSVIYRMALASGLLFAWCRLRQIPLGLSLRDHRFMAAQGCFLFGLNYWTIYWSEVYLPSGLVAVIFSLLVFFNIINGRIFFKHPVTLQTVVGGLVGLTGICMLFYPEFALLSDSAKADSSTILNGPLLGFGLAFIAVMFASLGNIVATRNGNTGISVWAINAWSIFYGTVILTLIALVTGAEFSYGTTLEYSLSLIYLSVFGTILAFGAYLKLLINIGPSRAGYTSLIIPFVAIILSTLFEDYQWTLLAAGGFVLVALGNYMVLKRR